MNRKSKGGTVEEEDDKQEEEDERKEHKVGVSHPLRFPYLSA